MDSDDTGVKQGSSQPEFPDYKNLRGKFNRPSVVVILLLAGAVVVGGVWAYSQGYNPFRASLKPDQVIRNMFASMAGVTAAHYDVAFTVESQAREAGRESIPTDFPEAAKQAEVFDRDQKRLSALSLITSFLRSSQSRGGQYPSDLKSLFSFNSESILDPSTHQQYGYRQEKSGQDFTLTIQLESDTGVQAYKQALKRQDKSSSPTPLPAITNRIIEVHAATPSVYAYISRSWFFSKQGVDYYQYLPTELKAELKVGGQSEVSAAKINDAAYNASGKLDLGDSSFAAGLDIVKKADDFYVRLNQAPSFGFFDLAALKGKWIKIVPDDANGTAIGSFLKSPSKSVNEHGSRFVKQFQILVDALNKNNVIQVVKELSQEKKGNTKLYHYEIKFDHTRFADFYHQLATNSEKEFGDDSVFTYNQEIENYLKSEEFQAFAQVQQKNTKIELWVDAAHFWPSKLTYSYVLVPPDKVAKLKDKQYFSTTTIELGSVNQPVTVEVPATTISVEEAQALLSGKTVEDVQKDVKKNKDARVKSDVAQLRTLAEVYYDGNSGSYGNLSTCYANPTIATCKGGIVNSVTSLKKDIVEAFPAAGKLEVKDSKNTFCLSQNLPSGQSVCVDTTGNIKTSETTKCGTAPIACLP